MRRGDIAETGQTPHTFSNETDQQVEFLVIKQVLNRQDKRLLLKTDKNPSFTNKLTLQAITVKNGQRTLSFKKFGQLNIKVSPMPTDKEGPDGLTVTLVPDWQKKFAKTRPTETTFTLPQSENIDYDKLSGAIYMSNGAFVPIFVSKDKVYFKYVQLSC